MLTWQARYEPPLNLELGLNYSKMVGRVVFVGLMAVLLPLAVCGKPMGGKFDDISLEVDWPPDPEKPAVSWGGGTGLSWNQLHPFTTHYLHSSALESRTLLAVVSGGRYLELALLVSRSQNEIKYTTV